MKISVNKQEFHGNGKPITDEIRLRKLLINLDRNMVLIILNDIILSKEMQWLSSLYKNNKKNKEKGFATLLLLGCRKYKQLL